MSADRLVELAAGAPSSHLGEITALDMHAVASSVLGAELAEILNVYAKEHAGSPLNELSITARMRLVGQWISLRSDMRARCATHPSDTVRGWAAFAVGMATHRTWPERLGAIRQFADDAHFGVREWAWMAIRDQVVADPLDAIGALSSWTQDPSERIRRFAVESTRPRGVWAKKIDLLTREPEHGLSLLDPLSEDRARYVEDSIANWLNDAARTRPDFVRDTCARWSSRASKRLLDRAQRNLRG